MKVKRTLKIAFINSKSIKPGALMTLKDIVRSYWKKLSPEERKSAEHLFFQTYNKAGFELITIPGSSKKKYKKL